MSQHRDSRLDFGTDQNMDLYLGSIFSTFSALTDRYFRHKTELSQKNCMFMNFWEDYGSMYRLGNGGSREYVQVRQWQRQWQLISHFMGMLSF